MNLTVAKTAGFCFGVKRAVDRVYEQIETADKQVYTFGPIIHNEMVVEDLAKHGVKVIDSEEELRRLEDGVVVIRSHGVGKREKRHDRGCDLPVCEKDPSDRPEAECRGTPCSDYRKSDSSGGRGHPWMGCRGHSGRRKCGGT